MVQYKVVKEFACGKKGDILTWNDETEMFEFYFKDETSERALFMDKDTCDEYVDEAISLYSMMRMNVAVTILCWKRCQTSLIRLPIRLIVSQNSTKQITRNSKRLIIIKKYLLVLKQKLIQFIITLLKY